MTFQEKGRWLLFVSLTAVVGIYFVSVLPPTSADVTGRQVSAFVGVVVLLVVLEALGTAVLALLDRHHEVDERDRRITLLGQRNGSYVLAAGAFTAIATALLTEGDFLFVHVLLAFWVLSELVSLGSQLYLYRR